MDRAAARAIADAAREAYGELVRRHPGDEQYRFGLAQAEVNLGTLVSSPGEPKHALALYNNALERLGGLVRDYPFDADYQSELAAVLRNLGAQQQESRQFQAARASYDEARATFERLAREHPAVVRYREGLADSLYNLGNLYAIDLMASEGVANHEEALKIGTQLVREQPTVTEHRARLARIQGQIGALCRYTEPAKALASFEQARTLLQRLVEDHPAVVRYRMDLAITHYFIGERQLVLRRSAEGLASLRQARDLAEELVRELPEDPAARRVLAAIWDCTGRGFGDTGRLRDEVLAYESAIEHERWAYARAGSGTKLRRDGAYDLADLYERLAEVQRRLDQPSEAMASLRAALDVLAERPEADKPDHFIIARLYSQSGRLVGWRRPNLTADEEAQRRNFCDLAAASLRKSAAGGPVRLHDIKTDSRFDALRSDRDFPLLMMDLVMPEKPFVPAR
jgi:tetratricopeptide (TPR) repeat protein